MSSRADDLTADLLHDLTAEQSASSPPPQRHDAAAFVDTDLFLAPRSWKRPGVGREGATWAFRAGPVQVRLGRRR